MSHAREVNSDWRATCETSPPMSLGAEPRRAEWTPCQSFVGLGRDEQALANDLIVELEAGDGGCPIKLVQGLVQYDRAPVEITRASDRRANRHVPGERSRPALGEN